MKLLRLPLSFRSEMIAQVENHPAEEMCGLIGGRNGQGEWIIPVSNYLHSPTEFQMDPLETLNAFNAFERQGFELMAIYHSHLQGPAFPSQIDVEKFAYPGVFAIIISPGNDGWRVDGYEIMQKNYYEISIEWITAT